MEPTIGSQAYFTGSTSDYSSCSYQSRIATSASQTPKVYQTTTLMKCADHDFKGDYGELDNKPLDDHKKKHTCLNSNADHNSVMHNGHLISAKSDLWKLHAAKNIKDLLPTYNVLVGNFVKVYDTKLCASLPLHDKFMIKERVKDNIYW